MSRVDFEFIWSMLPFPAFVVSPDDRVIEANLAAEQMVKTSVKQMRQKTIAQIFGANSVIADTTRQARDTKGSLTQYNVEVAVQERSTPCNLHVGAMDDDAANLLLIIQPTGTAQKMGRSLTNLAAARSVEAMAAMLAHEIRNPLAGISGAAQLLAMTGSDAEQELTGLIEQEARRIAQLVERVEHFSDQRAPERKPLNIHDILDRACRSAKAGFGAHVTFGVDYDPSLPEVSGDGNQLLQVFQNLLKNAAEAVGDTRGTIKIRTSYSSGVKYAVAGNRSENLPLQVEVIDNGKGIPDNLIADIFEPFVTSKVNGRGLGLPLVSKIIAAHGGMIECASQTGRTVFRVRLPIWRDAMEAN